MDDGGAPRGAVAELVEIDGITKTFRSQDGADVLALEPIFFRIGSGQFLSILGPSGCGKSTLLMIIAGLVQPSGGRVLIQGRDVRKDPPDIGVVFQDPVLFPWRNSLKNVELPAEVAGVGGRERREAARDLLNLVGLSGFEGKYPHELSGGMQQRVSIARALMRTPSLLLMDEPFGALDAMTREQMNLEIQRISQQSKTTVVFVTHSVSEAAFLSDSVVVMTGRPGAIREIVPIDMPRPRPIQFVSSDRFGGYVLRLRQLLDAHGGIA